MLLQKVLITITLCTLYAYFFGRVSLEKFYQHSVVVTHQQLKTNSISPPGMNKSLCMILCKVNVGFAAMGMGFDKVG